MLEQFRPNYQGDCSLCKGRDLINEEAFKRGWRGKMEHQWRVSKLERARKNAEPRFLFSRQTFSWHFKLYKSYLNTWWHVQWYHRTTSRCSKQVLFEENERRSRWRQPVLPLLSSSDLSHTSDLNTWQRFDRKNATIIFNALGLIWIEWKMTAAQPKKN